MAAVLCADMSDSILAVPKIEHLALHGMAFVPITETLSEALLLSSESPSYTEQRGSRAGGELDFYEALMYNQSVRIQLPIRSPVKPAILNELAEQSSCMHYRQGEG
jgi:hypothetical protein